LQQPTLSRLINNEAYLGHASMTNPVAALPANNYQGAIDEFRIWNGALTRLQVETSFAAGPTNATVNPGAPSSLTLTLNDPTMVLGTIQRPTVSATFGGLGKLDLTSVPDVVFTSSDSTKIQVIGGGDTRLQAVGTGTANIIASYGGLSSTSQVTVISVPALRIAHRYSFRGNAADSVGHADATLRGQASLVTNAVVLTGANNPVTHVQLPSDLISGYDQVTFEVFARSATLANFMRLFDFGNRFSGAGFNYIYYTPFASNARLGIPGQQGEVDLLWANAANNATHHAVVTINSSAGIATVYTNAVLAASFTNRAINLLLVNDVYSQLGRSQFGDPPFAGAIDEFRLYSGVMSAGQVAASYAAGADPENLTATLGAGSATLSWPAVPVLDGYSLQYATSLNPAVWNPAGSPTIVNGTNFVTVGLTNTAAFFRLIK
jgi:hypothetical protein